MSATFKTVLSRSDGADTAVEVTYEYSKACRGKRDKYGCPEEPDTPDSVEIISVSVDGIDLEISNAEEDSLIAEAYEDVRRQYEAAMEATAENQWEDRRLFRYR
jgi:hypothetical protein